ncbi:MAG TPA: DNRLRE domain-containing protein [Anaerolineales bacterium]|nr:DNRLRE domain-containing protein [Anaerolineales bacterium]HNN11962.1 DNRLRE domain-containing protein [Anaerolineales bacterium]
MGKYTRMLFSFLVILILCTQIAAAPVSVNSPETSAVFLSFGILDGWLLESSENSNVANTYESGAKTIYIGDDATNRQYRAIFSFDTSSLPDDATITAATLKFKYAGVIGTLPFNTHGNLMVDVRRGSFSNDPSLQFSDFKAAAGKNNLLSFTSEKLNNWYSKSITPARFGYINLTGVTQFRLRFNLDDNNDFGADLLKIYSGNAGRSLRPQLVISYTTPVPDPIIVHDITELIAAINTANANGVSKDTIDLAAGTYLFTTSYDGSTALPVITSPITIQGNNNELQRDISALDFRIFQVGSQGNLTINDLTIRRGIAGGINDGGGIMNEGVVNLNNVTLSENAGDMGGAIYNAGQLKVSNSTFTGNHAGRGGGIYSSGPGLILDLVNLDTNFATYGAGLYLNNTATITNSLIKGNSGGCCGGWGGGIYVQSGPVTISDSIISENRGYFGAAINVNGDLSLSKVQIINNDNAVTAYGVILQNAGTLAISDSLLGGNLNGGMLRLGGSATISNSCIINNSPNDSGFVVSSNATSIQAANNWWGNLNGPSGLGGGDGDPVGSNVIYSPFASSAISTCPVAAEHISGFGTYPPSPSVPTGVSFNLSTKIFGTGNPNQSAQWQVLSGNGNISTTTGATVLFTAPATPDTTVLRVTSDADPTKTVDVSVKTVQFKFFSIDPHAPIRVLTNGSVKIFASAINTGGGTFPLTYTLTGAGSLDLSTPWNNGIATTTTYHAPGSETTATVRVSLKYFPDYYLDIPVHTVASGSVSCSSPTWPIFFSNDLGGSTYSVSMGGLQPNQPGASSLQLFAPFDHIPNEPFTVMLQTYVKATAINPITQVNLRFDTDTSTDLGPYAMTLDSGDGFNGYWKWVGSIPDPICENYKLKFELISDASTSNLTVAPR